MLFQSSVLQVCSSEVKENKNKISWEISDRGTSLVSRKIQSNCLTHIYFKYFPNMLALVMVQRMLNFEL